MKKNLYSNSLSVKSSNRKINIINNQFVYECSFDHRGDTNISFLKGKGTFCTNELGHIDPTCYYLSLAHNKFTNKSLKWFGDLESYILDLTGAIVTDDIIEALVKCKKVILKDVKVWHENGELEHAKSGLPVDIFVRDPSRKVIEYLVAKGVDVTFN